MRRASAQWAKSLLALEFTRRDSSWNERESYFQDRATAHIAKSLVELDFGCRRKDAS